MSCGLALALALVATDAPAATVPVTLAAAAAPANLVQEPLYAEIVARAKGLHLRVSTTRAVSPSELQALKAEVDALAALDMQGHYDLKARNVDGDLKCILKGIAEDLPKRLEDLAKASDPAARETALKEMGYLLNDNVEVVTAPPGPATPPPAA